MRPKDFANVYAVVLCGGKGKRLRPLSTYLRPKAFLSVTKNRRTIFRNTIDRISEIVPPERIVAVANKAHSGLVRRDLPRASRKNIILEPASRNTAPAIALAGHFLKRVNEDAVMLVLPADQYLPGRDNGIGSIKKCINFVVNNGNVIAVIGLKPRYASTEFGYIRVAGSGAVAKVKRFTEKPGSAVAMKYFMGGKHLWNAGIFIFRVGTLLSALKKHAPEIFQALKSGRIDKSYEKMPNIPIDRAIMEKADNVYCVRGSYEWVDLGSFDALEKVLKKESRRFVKRDGKIVKIL